MGVTEFSIVSELDSQKNTAVELLFTKELTGKTYEQIAEEVGISARQLRRWRTEDQQFINELKAMGASELVGAIPLATGLLTKILSNPDEYKESTQMEAIKLLLKSTELLKGEQTEVVVNTHENQAQVDKLLESYGIS